MINKKLYETKLRSYQHYRSEEISSRKIVELNKDLKETTLKSMIECLDIKAGDVFMKSSRVYMVAGSEPITAIENYLGEALFKISVVKSDSSARSGWSTGGNSITLSFEEIENLKIIKE